MREVRFATPQPYTGRSCAGYQLPLQPLHFRPLPPQPQQQPQHARAPPLAPQTQVLSRGREDRRCVELARRRVVWVAGLLVANVVCGTILSRLLIFVDMEDALSKVREVTHFHGGPHFHAASMLLSVIQSIGLQILIGSLVPLCGYIAVRENKQLLLRSFNCCNGLTCILGLIMVLGSVALLISMPGVQHTLEAFLERCDPIQCMPDGPNGTDQAHIVDCLAQGMWPDYKPVFSGPRYPNDCPKVFLKCDGLVDTGLPWSPDKECSLTKFIEKFHEVRELVPQLEPNIAMYLVIRAVVAIPTILLSFLGCVSGLALQKELMNSEHIQGSRRRTRRSPYGPSWPRRCRLDIEPEVETQEPLIQEVEMHHPLIMNPTSSGMVMPNPHFGLHAPQCMYGDPMLQQRPLLFNMMPGAGVPMASHGMSAPQAHSIEVSVDTLGQPSEETAPSKPEAGGGGVALQVAAARPIEEQQLLAVNAPCQGQSFSHGQEPQVAPDPKIPTHPTALPEGEFTAKAQLAVVPASTSTPPTGKDDLRAAQQGPPVQ